MYAKLRSRLVCLIIASAIIFMGIYFDEREICSFLVTSNSVQADAVLTGTSHVETVDLGLRETFNVREAAQEFLTVRRYTEKAFTRLITAIIALFNIQGLPTIIPGILIYILFSEGIYQHTIIRYIHHTDGKKS